MVIHGSGSHCEVIKRFEPTSEGEHVEFTTLLDPVQMPGQRRSVLKCRMSRSAMDEAMHP